MGKRIRAQRKGSSPRYRVSSHRFPGANRMPRDMDVVGEVTELVHSPVHTAPLARVKLPDGDTTLVVATEGVSIGSKIAIGDNESLRPGNITLLSEIPEGTAINNVELRPGDGGKVARSAGNSCIVEAKIGDKVRIPHVSGVAMNPVDHPHGGGNHQAVHGPNSVARSTPPGAKVGLIAPRRTGRGRGKRV